MQAWLQHSGQKAGEGLLELHDQKMAGIKKKGKKKQTEVSRKVYIFLLLENFHTNLDPLALQLWSNITTQTMNNCLETENSIFKLKSSSLYRS